MRQTSIEAYRRIEEDGSLSAAQWAVYDALFRSPAGLTRNELDQKLSPGRPNALHSRRLAEMERAGVVRRLAARACSVSGHKCEVWDVTDAVPSEVGRRGRQSKAPPMPSRADAAALLPAIDEQLGRLGDGAPEHLVALRAWLAAGAPRSAPRRSETAPGRRRDAGGVDAGGLGAHRPHQAPQDGVAEARATAGVGPPARAAQAWKPASSSGGQGRLF